MQGSLAARAEVHPRTARTIAIAVLGSLVSVYALGAISGPGKAAVVVPLTLAVLGLQFRYVLSSLRRFQTRGVTALQALLVYVAVLASGVSVGIIGLLIGSLLLASAWRTALVAGLTVPVIHATRAESIPNLLDFTITPVLIALVTYGLSRLTDRIDEVHAARVTLALVAVEEERLRMAAELNESVGRGLDTIAAARPENLEDVLAVARRSLATARSAAADLRSLSLTPEISAARGLLSAAEIEATVRVGHEEPLGQAGALLATVLREAVTDVVRQGTARHCAIETTESEGLVVLRVTNDGVPTAALGAEALIPLAEQVEAVGGHLRTGLGPDGRFTVEAAIISAPAPAAEASREHRLAAGLLAVVLAGFCAKAFLLLTTPWTLLAAVPCLTLVVLLQLRWTRPRGDHWVWLLLLQAVLSYVPLVWFGKAWGGLPGFLAGTLLVALPAAVAWPLVVVVMTSMGLIAWSLDLGTPVIVNSVVSVLVTGLVVYGLVRLAQLADELRAAGAGVARAAIVQERLRAARDLHDLLGHSLAALLLKGELARRLFAVDRDRAQAELADVVEMAVRARADMETVTGAAPRLELEPELASARSVLSAAGIDVRVVRDGAPPSAAEGVLSTVLREAVTNMLRHSAARHCEITVGADRLVVENDGSPSEVTPPGSGIGNLTTRLGALGGQLDARLVGDGRFRVTAMLEPAADPVTGSVTVAPMTTS
ncbi:sensor histidine kinase [Actinomadura sp. 6N118]|uniref:sensor histidine kinase n=1 Tax=Actinomadura sp. 6N118 TaxID=3375151 RepID=UPI00379AB4AA